MYRYRNAFALGPVLAFAAGAVFRDHRPGQALPEGVPATTPPANTLGEAVTLFGKAREEYHAEVAKFGAASQESANKLAAINERMDHFEVMLKRPPIERAGSMGEVEQTQEAKSFCQYLRRGEKGITPEEAKTLVSSSDSDGGFLMPVNIATEIIKKLILFSPVRELADVVTISQGDSMEFPAEGSTDFDAGWVGEDEARAATTTGNLRNVTITTMELYAKPKISQRLLDDNAFNIETWIADRVAMRFAVKEGAAFVSGTGSKQPQGLLTASGVNATNTGHATLVTADGIHNLFYALPEFYFRNAKWLMKRATMGAIRILKDGQGQYLWSPGLRDDQPGALLGHEYRETPDMPSVGAGTYPIIFGDIKRAYRIIDRMGVRVIRDIYSSKPLIEFYSTKRVGGAVVLAEAMVKQLVSA